MASFAPAIWGGFVWDDTKNLVDNPHYRGLGPTQIAWMFTAFHMGHYIPLTWLTFGLDFALWGMRPAGYHLTNLLLHAGAILAAYHVTVRILRAQRREQRGAAWGIPIGAALSAALFGLHPLRVESVAWATERRDVLSGLLYLLAVLTYLVAQDGATASSRRRRWLIAALALFAASLASKATAVTLPALLLILDVYPLRRLPADPRHWRESRARRALIEKAPFAALAAAASAVAFVALRGAPEALSPLGAMGVIDRLAISAYAASFYVCRMLVPIGLSPLYEVPEPLHATSWPFLASGAFVLAASLASVCLARRLPSILAVWIAYLVMLLPVVGLVHNGPQIAADRYTYLPSLPWAVLSGGAFAWFYERAGARGRAAAALLAIHVLAGSSVLTWHQTRVWRDSETLWRHAISASPSAIAHHNLGVALLAKGERTEAVRHFRTSISMRPNQAKAHVNLGVALAELGELDQAIFHFRWALDLDPRLDAVRANLATALRRRQGPPASTESLRQ